MSLLAQRYVLWTESLFREWAKWLSSDECRVLMMVCKRWRHLTFRPQFYFSKWGRPQLQFSGTDDFLVVIRKEKKVVRHSIVTGLPVKWKSVPVTDWFGLDVDKTGTVRWVQNKRCRGRNLSDPKIQAQLRLFAEGWGQLWTRIQELRTAEEAAIPPLENNSDVDWSYLDDLTL